MKIIECVPNISEGKNKSKIESIIKEVKEIPGVYLLDVYTGFSTNRTVLTLAGYPEPVKKAAFRIFERTSALIDMRKHKGHHPRMGALDVCPFIPLKNVTMEECNQIALEVGKKVGEKLGIPVFLYERSATEKKRKELSNIRKGEYEGLLKKIYDFEWKPDFGPAEFNEKSGATVIGARKPLIAFNINLNVKDKKYAKTIAKNIRKSDLSKVKAIGWYIEELGCAQVSTNLTDFYVTPIYRVFEEVKREARKIDIKVTGSELVGLVPEKAILETGKFYLNKESSIKKPTHKQIIEAAFSYLGVSEKDKLNPEEKILEYKLKKEML